MGWARSTDEKRNKYKILIWEPWENGPLGDLGLDGKIILKLILKK
jgi:hypothetical protein